MQNEPPVSIIQSQLDELFGNEELWLAMLEPGLTEIPEGCNFIFWFESRRSPEELVGVAKQNQNKLKTREMASDSWGCAEHQRSC